MFKSRKSLLLGMMALLAPMASAASAQDNGLGYAYLFGYGASNTSAIRSYVPPPPYFALHPPVYYGQRYTRPYGESPFAAWPQLRSPAGYYPRPAAPHAQPVIINFAPAHPQAGSAPVIQTVPSYPAPTIVPTPSTDPFPSGHQVAPAAPQAPAPAAPAAPAPAAPAPVAPAKPSPVVIQARPIQPLVVENPYYRDNDSRFVGKSAIGQ